MKYVSLQYGNVSISHVFFVFTIEINDGPLAGGGDSNQFVFIAKGMLLTTLYSLFLPSTLSLSFYLETLFFPL